MKINFIEPHIINTKYNLKAGGAQWAKNQTAPAFLGTDEFEFSNPGPDYDAVKSEYVKFLSERIGSIREFKDYYLSGQMHEEKLQSHPSVAFLYNPGLNRKEKMDILDKSKTVFSRAGLANKMGLHPEKIYGWIQNGNIEPEIVSYLIFGTSDSYYVDTEIPKNKAFLEYIESILPHSVAGEDLLKEYNFSHDTVRKFVQQGKLRPAGYDEAPEKYIGPFNLLFDMEDEVNKDTIERYSRTTPLKSKRYGEGKRRLVPVKYLEKLGYGDAKALYKMVKGGILPGKIERLEENRLRVAVDIGAKNVRAQLDRMRCENPDIISGENFREECELTKTAFNKALEDGEIEIIREYIFDNDYKEILLSRKNPKNAAFLDRVYFEKQLIEDKRAEKRAKVRQERIARIRNPIESLRRTLVWSMCPYTKMVAGETARQDGLASRVLGKISEEGIETLTTEENAKYRSYCKNFWAIAGTEEFREAHKKAKEIIEQFKQGGIEAVEDPEAKKIIEAFLKEFEGTWTP